MAASDVAANASFTALTTDADFTLPAVDISGPAYQLPSTTGDLYAAITKLTNADLTTGEITGQGTFDRLMAGFKGHLEAEFKNQRITGSEYTKAYIALTEGAMSNAVQFLLSRDTSYWQSVGAQLQAQIASVQLVTARVGLETVKAQLQEAQIRAQSAKAEYALTKARLATESVNYDTAVYSLAYILPKQLATMQAELDLTESKILTEGVGRSTATYNLEQILPQQKLIMTNEKSLGDVKITHETAAKDTTLYTLNNMLPQQLALVKEQTETQRAQTMDTRTDNTTPVAGSVGKQKDLYAQQITSYKRDAEVKVAKIFSDAWTVQKSMDEGTLPPTGFSNTSLDAVLTKLKTLNDLT